MKPKKPEGIGTRMIKNRLNLKTEREMIYYLNYTLSRIFRGGMHMRICEQKMDTLVCLCHSLRKPVIPPQANLLESA